MNNKTEKGAITAIIATACIWLGIVGINIVAFVAVIWVAWHFISKFW